MIVKLFGKWHRVSSQTEAMTKCGLRLHDEQRFPLWHRYLTCEGCRG